MEDRLEKAMEEIQATVHKYNLGSFVALTDGRDGFHKTSFPTWSAAQLRGKGENETIIHFKVNDVEEQRLRNTCTMLMHIKDMCGLAFSKLSHCLSHVSKFGNNHGFFKEPGKYIQ